MDYITISGAKHYLGIEAFRVGQILYLEKDRDNEYDDEAIAVFDEERDCYGYVANSVYTVARGTKSAGRIYDMFEEHAKVEVCFITNDCVIARLIEDKKILYKIDCENYTM